jgi:dihydroflavonol-4-reductase
MANAPILVTGATGLLGNNVVRLLLAREERVRVLVREAADPRPLEGLDLEITRGDVRDEASVRAASKGAKAIIHAAAWVQLGWRKLDLARDINVRGTCHVADAAREAGIRLIHVSTTDALAHGSLDQPADEETPGEKLSSSYVITKREAEREVLNRVAGGLDAVIVNPCFLIGPWDWKPSSGRMLLEIAQRNAPIAPRGCISICDPRDVAAGMLSALERGQSGRRYILAGENMTYFDAWKRFAALTGRRGPIKKMSRIVAWLGGTAGDLWERCTGRDSLINSAAIGLGNSFHCYSSRRAAEELGYRSRPADESIRDAWEWFVAHGYVRRRQSVRPRGASL